MAGGFVGDFFKWSFGIEEKENERFLVIVSISDHGKIGVNRFKKA